MFGVIFVYCLFICFNITSLAACTGASVSYYAHQVVQEYFNPVLPYNQPLYLRFEYGSALFIGWVSLVIGKTQFLLHCIKNVGDHFFMLVTVLVTNPVQHLKRTSIIFDGITAVI